MDNLNKYTGTLITRLLLGFIFFMQGYGKVFTWGVGKVYAGAFQPYDAYLPEFLLQMAAYYTSYVELIGGALLVVGLFRNYALYALGSVLVIVTFGHGLSEPIWDLQHVMYRAVLLVALLIFPEDWDRFSLDDRIRKYREKPE